MRIGRYGRGTRIAKALFHQNMGSDALINIKYFDPLLLSKHPAPVLVGRIFLIRSRGIAVKSKKGACRIIN